jgi:hypothetical protein
MMIPHDLDEQYQHLYKSIKDLFTMQLQANDEACHEEMFYMLTDVLADTLAELVFSASADDNSAKLITKRFFERYGHTYTTLRKHLDRVMSNTVEVEH